VSLVGKQIPAPSERQLENQCMRVERLDDGEWRFGGKWFR